jgi:hypothetical protein
MLPFAFVMWREHSPVPIFPERESPEEATPPSRGASLVTVPKEVLAVRT